MKVKKDDAKMRHPFCEEKICLKRLIYMAGITKVLGIIPVKLKFVGVFVERVMGGKERGRAVWKGDLGVFFRST